MLDLNERKGPPEPSARRLAQMTALAKSVKLPVEFAPMMARMEVSEARAMAADLKSTVVFLEEMGEQFRDWVPKIEELVADLSAEDQDDEGDGEEQPTSPVLARVAKMLNAKRVNKSPMRSRTIRGSQGNRVGMSWDHGEGFRAKMTDAAIAKMNGAHEPTVGREFASISFAEMAAMCLRSEGHRIKSINPAKVVMEGLHTTSDFPKILGDAVNRRMLDFYEAAASGVKMASLQTEARDFRPMSNLRLGGALELSKVNEAGEYTHGTVEEAGESFRVETYGKILAVSRQLIVNDDVSAFNNVARIQGQGAALTEAKVFVALLEENSGAGPTMEDGTALFDADHGNLAGSGAAISVETLSAARTALRRQTGLGGERISVVPVYLVVPPELETVAEQMLAELTAADVGKVNPFSGKLTLVVDPHLTDPARWYVTAAPGKPDGLRHAYLGGAGGPEFFTDEGFEVDGMRFKCRLDFGAGFADWRAWYCNPGD